MNNEEVAVANGMPWHYTIDEGGAVICNMPKATSGKIIIPRVLDNITVTEIGDWAFR